MLGDAENAAHTLWTTNTEKLRRNYQGTQKLITAIKKAVVQLHDLLAEVREERDEDALLQFFWIDEPEAKGQNKKKKVTPPKPPVPPPPPKLQKYKINQVVGGFSISISDDISPDMLPLQMTAVAAYAVSSGNAFKKYSPLDFKMGRNGDVSVSSSDTNAIKIITSAENRVEFEVIKCPVRVNFTGFDENRDLKVKVSEIK